MDSLEIKANGETKQIPIHKYEEAVEKRMINLGGRRGNASVYFPNQITSYLPADKDMEFIRETCRNLMGVKSFILVQKNDKIAIYTSGSKKHDRGDKALQTKRQSPW